MFIIGAGGLAKQLLEVAIQLNKLNEVILFDDISLPPVHKLYGRVPVLCSKEKVESRFKEIDNKFILGIANPARRFRLAGEFEELGGELQSLIAPKAWVSPLATQVGKGVNILTNVVLENGAHIGDGALLNVGAFIAHGVQVGRFTEIAPAVQLLGNCKVGSFCFIGARAVILPGISVGNNVVIGAGAVVTENVADNVMVAGIPARVKKHL